MTTASVVTALATPSVDTATVTLSRAAKTADVDTVGPVAPAKDDPVPAICASVVDMVQDSADPSMPDPTADVPKMRAVDAAAE